MKRLLLFTCTVLFTSQVFAQGLTGEWLVYEGSDGSELVLTLTSGNSGKAELSLVRRMQAVSYGEGSQFWDTFQQ